MFNLSVASVPFGSAAPMRAEPPRVPAPHVLRLEQPLPPETSWRRAIGVERSALPGRLGPVPVCTASRPDPLLRVERTLRDSPVRERLSGLGGLGDAVRIADMHARGVSYDTFARAAGLPREIGTSPSPYLPADARADDLYTTPVPGRPLRLSARTLAQGATIKGLRARRGDPPIEYWLEVPPAKAFLSVSLSGGTGAAQIEIYTPRGTRVPACERMGLNTGTSKTCIVDLRAFGQRNANVRAVPGNKKPDVAPADKALTVAPEDSAHFVVRIQPLPKVRGFRNVAFAVKAADFDAAPV